MEVVFRVKASILDYGLTEHLACSSKLIAEGIAARSVVGAVDMATLRAPRKFAAQSLCVRNPTLLRYLCNLTKFGYDEINNINKRYGHVLVACE